MMSESDLNNLPPVFNIKAVVKQTGLNPATIRAWERRYGFPQPKRTSGGHRQYSQRDIDTLKWLIDRQEEGMSISHAIELWRTSVEGGRDPIESGVSDVVETKVRPTLRVKGEKIEELHNAWISACLAFDKNRAEQVLARAFALFSPEIVCIELLQKGLVEVGNGWYRGDVTIQQEHFTSALSIQRLELLIAATPPPTRPERIIVATAPGDYHVFSPRLLTYLLRRRGWDVFYLGADVPAENLESTIWKIEPELVIVSAQLLHTAANLREIAQALTEQGVMLAFGGLVFNQVPTLRQYITGHFLGETLEGVADKVSSLLHRRPLVLQAEALPVSYEQALTQYTERRSLIESHIWSTFSSKKLTTKHLIAINLDFAKTIEAALKLGNIDLLSTDITWIEHLLMGYRLPKEWIKNYLLAYYQAVKIHLGQPANMIVDWLSKLLDD